MAAFLNLVYIKFFVIYTYKVKVLLVSKPPFALSGLTIKKVLFLLSFITYELQLQTVS